MSKQIKAKIKKLSRKVRSAVLIGVIFGISGVGSYVVGQYQESQRWSSLVDQYQEQSISPVEEGPEGLGDTIKRVCDQKGVDWVQCLLVANCESRMDRYFKERMNDGSYDRGVFAINSRHYAKITDDCAFDPECATTVFAEGVKNGKMRDWLCARSLGFVK